MKATQKTYVKHLFNDLCHFATGISFKFLTDRYHFLETFADNHYFKHNHEWTEEQIWEAINVFFHICSQDKVIANHIKSLVGFATQTSIRAIDSDSFTTHKLYGDAVCIKIAEAFGIVATAKNGNHIVFSDWIAAFADALTNNIATDFPRYKGILDVGKTIRNNVAHTPANIISRTKWVPTLIFLLNSYICLCLLLIYVKGNPFSQTEPGIVDLQTERVAITTDTSVSVIIIEAGRIVHHDATSTTTRWVELKKYTDYTIIIGEQTHQVTLVATDRDINIEIDYENNLCKIMGNAPSVQASNIINSSTMINSTPTSNSSVPKNTLWRNLTVAISRLYATGSMMYSLYPNAAKDRAEMLKLLRNPDAPCEGAFNERVKSFGEHLKLVAEVLSKIMLDDATLNEYLERAKAIDSKVKKLGYNNTHLEMSDLASLEELLYGIGDILCNNAPIGRLISAWVYTNTGHCNNANTNAFFFMGNTLYPNSDNSQLWNVGAAILHDLYMILPEEFRCQVKSNFADALASAENQWDMYYVRFNK